jgi:hypothetical protein
LGSSTPSATSSGTPTAQAVQSAITSAQTAVTNTLSSLWFTSSDHKSYELISVYFLRNYCWKSTDNNCHITMCTLVFLSWVLYFCRCMMFLSTKTNNIWSYQLISMNWRMLNLE